jgi:hypothetical protein
MVSFKSFGIAAITLAVGSNALYSRQVAMTLDGQFPKKEDCNEMCNKQAEKAINNLNDPQLKDSCMADNEATLQSLPPKQEKKKGDGQKIQIMCPCRMEIMLWRVHKEKHNGKSCDSHGDELKTRLLAVAIPGGKDVSKAVKDWKVKNDNVH